MVDCHTAYTASLLIGDGEMGSVFSLGVYAAYRLIRKRWALLLADAPMPKGWWNVAKYTLCMSDSYLTNTYGVVLVFFTLPSIFVAASYQHSLSEPAITLFMLVMIVMPLFLPRMVIGGYMPAWAILIIWLVLLAVGEAGPGCHDTIHWVFLMPSFVAALSLMRLLGYARTIYKETGIQLPLLGTDLKRPPAESRS